MKTLRDPMVFVIGVAIGTTLGYFYYYLFWVR